MDPARQWPSGLVVDNRHLDPVPAWFDALDPDRPRLHLALGQQVAPAGGPELALLALDAEPGRRHRRHLDVSRARPRAEGVAKAGQRIAQELLDGRIG